MLMIKHSKFFNLPVLLLIFISYNPQQNCYIDLDTLIFSTLQVKLICPFPTSPPPQKKKTMLYLAYMNFKGLVLYMIYSVVQTKVLFFT